ncbi:HD domain-containing protein [Desulfuromusa kysingii]|uniref:HD domain-containing protein n=1 Tax=Desulfuromusa kysingii TaxID=37625 RepID=A0A1H3ZPH1_9BACT|nr:HD domain-containing phosphohydrolase [Desulfuromusa kysingii]SEA25676.1 HD domain-containing protein [Desulfuromusa kysingii]
MISPQEDHLQKLIRLLTTAAANVALYHPEHRQVLRLNKQALNELQQLFNIHNDITLKVIDGLLIFANKPVSRNLAIDRLLESLSRNGISYVQIESGVYAEELLNLINILSKAPEKQIDIKGSENIHFGQVEIRYKDNRLNQSPEIQFEEISGYEADRFMDLYQTVRSKKKLEMAGINEIVNGFVHAFNSQSDAFMAIAPLRSMDEYTYTHSTNICMLNLAQAKVLGIEGQLLNDIGIAAMLHDVGKMFIPPDILSKTGKLTAEEWQIMEQHPRLGAEYLLNTPGVPRLAVVTAFEHHMRYDNSGYPKTKVPWTQHICSHMTAISDTYDAMRTHRAYDDSMEIEQIISIMLDLAGTKLHPQLTYSFLQVLSELDKKNAPSNYTSS